jgi:hypothetical protein
VEIAAITIAAVSAAFAALAAWYARGTVRLMLEIRDDEDRRRILDAVIRVDWAARDLESSRSNADQKRLHAAFQELKRAIAFNPMMTNATEKLMGYEGDYERTDPKAWNLVEILLLDIQETALTALKEVRESILPPRRWLLQRRRRSTRGETASGDAPRS